MIEELHGRRETVLHPATQAFRLYMNIEAENYPAHWHTDLEIIMPTMAVRNRIWKKRAMHIWMILPEMPVAKTIRNLPVMSITGDSLDARASRGVQFISSGNW